MSNFIPMVSSSPPPMEDGGFGWDEDDDDFGTFTGADDSSFSNQAAPDTAGQPPPKGQDSPISPGVTENQESSKWHQSNGQVIQESKAYVDDNFAIFPEDETPEETNDKTDIADSRPSRIDIAPDLEPNVDDKNDVEIKGDDKGPLTDSGLYSADISPVQNCDDDHNGIKGQGDSHRFDERSSDCSPVLFDSDRDPGEANVDTQNERLENVPCETESITQEIEKLEQHKQSEICENKESPSTNSESSNANDSSDSLNSSQIVNNDQCDKNIPFHENSQSPCSNTELVTDGVQEALKHDSQTSNISEEKGISATVHDSDNISVDPCDDKDLDCQVDDPSCSQIDTSTNMDDDLRKPDFDSPPIQTVNDCVPNSISEEANSALSDEDAGDFESTGADSTPVSESKSVEDLASKDGSVDENACNESASEKSLNVNSDIQETEDWGDFDTATEEVLNKSEEESCDETKESAFSEHIMCSVDADSVVSTEAVSDVKESNELTEETCKTQEKVSDKEGCSDKNNCSGQSENSVSADASAIQSSDHETAESEENKDENLTTFCDDDNDDDDFGDFNRPDTSGNLNIRNNEGKSSDDDMGNFKEPETNSNNDGDEYFGDFNGSGMTKNLNISDDEGKCSDDDTGKLKDPETNSNDDDDFGDFNGPDTSKNLNISNDEDKSSGDDEGNFKEPESNLNADDDFGNFSDTDDFGAFDNAGNGFAAFGDSAEDGNVGDVSDSKNDWASFSEPQIVTAAEAPVEDDDDDEWAEFTAEPVPTPASPPPSSKTIPQKMSSLEKLVCAMTTVFPGVQSDSGSNIQVKDLDGLVCEREEEQGGTSVWVQIKAVHSTNAVSYQYTKSQWNDWLFSTLHVDTRNVLIGHKKAPVPIFASGLTLLEPTKGSTAALKPDVLVDTSKASDSIPQPQEAIPLAQFDWSSSGLKNPLEADNKTLNLDFLIQDQAVKSSALESEFLGSEHFEAPRKPSLQPLENILANMKSVSTVRPVSRPDNVSKEALKIVDSLPVLSFMKSKVLMFPLKLDQ